MKETMRKVAVFMVENSAHHFFRDFSYCDSGMIPWLIVAQIISETNESLYELVSDLEKNFHAVGKLICRQVMLIE